LLFSDITRFFQEGLKRLGFFLENGVASVREIFAEKARLGKLEMIDQDTGEIYCTWIASGEWVKVLGECDDSQGGLTPLGGSDPLDEVQLSPAAIETLNEMLESAASSGGEPRPDESGREPSSTEPLIEEPAEIFPTSTPEIVVEEITIE